MQYFTNSAEETERLGQRLGETLRGGEVVAYLGELGAGKTAFTRGLARGLGISMRVTSPTYTIVNEYTGGRLPLFHFDMYRLGSEEELFDIGWEDYLARGGVCAVEWSEKCVRRDGGRDHRPDRKNLGRRQKDHDRRECTGCGSWHLKPRRRRPRSRFWMRTSFWGESYLNCGQTHSRTLRIWRSSSWKTARSRLPM